MRNGSTRKTDLRVVVTGATGLMGTALVAHLRESGYGMVIPLSRKDGDLADQATAVQVIAAARPDVVYHLAGRVHGIMGNLRAQGDSYLQNLRINTNVVDAARIAGVGKLIAMGSTAIYSDQVPQPMREDDLWRGPPHASEAGYAHAKRAMLAQLVAYRDQFGLDYAFCIATNLFGPNDLFNEQIGHVVPSLISKFERSRRTGDPVTIWGSGTARRDLMFAPDAARALLLAGEIFTGPINIATGSTVTIAEVVRKLADITGHTGDIVWDRSKPDGQMLRDYDVSRLAELGYRPGLGLTDALKLTFDWLRDNRAVARR